MSSSKKLAFLFVLTSATCHRVYLNADALKQMKGDMDRFYPSAVHN